MFDTTVISAKTAIHRTRVSAPLQWLLDQDLIKGKCCNWGEGRAFLDTEAMQDRTGWCIGYDPMSTVDTNRWMPKGTFDTIYCGYVMNVVLVEEARHIEQQILDHLNPGGTAYIAVRIDEVHGTPYRDGVITKRGTFQASYKDFVHGDYTIHKTGHYAIYTLTKEQS
jgi:hypothetical protein